MYRANPDLEGVNIVRVQSLCVSLRVDGKLLYRVWIIFRVDNVWLRISGDRHAQLTGIEWLDALDALVPVTSPGTRPLTGAGTVTR